MGRNDVVRSFDSVSQKYCHAGSTLCDGRVNSPTYEKANDQTHGNNCKDYYLSYNNGNQEFGRNILPNSGWVCASEYASGCDDTCTTLYSNKICNNGACRAPPTSSGCASDCEIPDEEEE